MSQTSDQRKFNIYFPLEAAREITSVADKLNRPKSWVLQRAWELARKLLIQEKPRFKERWKNEFVEAVQEISERTEAYSEKEIESIAVQEAKKIKSR